MYGISTVGVGLDISGNPASSIYQITADGTGKVAGFETTSSVSPATYTLTGTYTINSNCTGTIVFTNQDHQTEHYTLMLNVVTLASCLRRRCGIVALEICVVPD